MNDALYIGLGYLGAGIGVGFALVGVGIGIGKVGAAAVEGTARQPEAVGELRNLMLIPAALIEGLGLFAIVVCLLLVLKKGPEPTASTSADHATATETAH